MTNYFVSCKHLEIFSVAGESECVVFNSQSGENHLLESVGASLFMMLHNRPCSHYELSVFVADFLNKSFTEGIERFTEEVIQQFQSLQIIEVVKKDIA